MIAADLALARRLERQEAVAGARFVEARRRLSPESCAEWIEVGGTYAMFDGKDSPLTQTFGLGIYAACGPEELSRLETFFQERGAAVSHEVCPLAGVELADRLCGRGYRPVEFSSVMYMPIEEDGPSHEVTNPRIGARRIVTGEEELWCQISAKGWMEQGEYLDMFLGLGRVMANSAGSYAFLAHRDGEAVGAAILRCHEGVALFAGASTVPTARKQGAQRALLEARMQLARELRCDVAMMCAAPGSASQRNAERLGFRIAYTRTKWQRRS